MLETDDRTDAGEAVTYFQFILSVNCAVMAQIQNKGTKWKLDHGSRTFDIRIKFERPRMSYVARSVDKRNFSARNFVRNLNRKNRYS